MSLLAFHSLAGIFVYHNSVTGSAKHMYSRYREYILAKRAQANLRGDFLVWLRLVLHFFNL